MNHQFRPAPHHLTREVVTKLEVKRSRFITHLARVEDEAGARAMVARARERWPDARHHCSAWVVAVAGQHDAENSSDDGEPSGTAGRPMLDVLRGADLGQVSAVVVRYFGGTLLGTGGLVRAYSEAVRTAVSRLDLVRVGQARRVCVEVGHADLGGVENALQGWGLAPVCREFDEATARLWVNSPEDGSVAAHLAALTHGRAVVRDEGVVEVETALR